MKQAGKDLMADVGQDGDEEEGEWQSPVRGCRMRQASLVQLAELINETTVSLCCLFQHWLQC